MCYYTDQQSSKKALPLITQGKPEIIQLIPWGLIPSWANESQAKELPLKTLNAKSETIFEKASFEPSILKQRCLVLVDGFFEWQHNGKEKIEYEIRLQQEGPFDGRNSQYKKRMPLILPFEKEKEWIQGMPTEKIKSFLKPYPSNKMKAKKVKPSDEQLHLF